MIAADPIAHSAILLNDANQTIFDNATQLRFLNIALEELRDECLQNNLPITNQTNVIYLILKGVDGIGGRSQIQPALPNDLIQPINIHERPHVSNTVTYGGFRLMEHVEFVPLDAVPTSALRYWSWTDTINFIRGGATSDVEIIIHYMRNIVPTVGANTDIISFSQGKLYLGFRTAALIAEFVGENKTRSDELNGFAGLALQRMLNINTKGRQSITTRRRPFMARWRAQKTI